jgi:translation initiation factor IF-3
MRTRKAHQAYGRHLTKDVLKFEKAGVEDEIKVQHQDEGGKEREKKREVIRKKLEAKKKQKQITVKEVKFRPGTGIGDYGIKVRNLTRFLNEGNKTKVTLRFRGREMAHRELGMEMLKRVEADLAEIALVEQAPAMEGRQMVMVLAPRLR